MSYIEFFFEIWEILKKIETDVDRLLLILNMNKNFRWILLKLYFFSFFKSTFFYLRLFVLSLPFSACLKQNLSVSVSCMVDSYYIFR